MFFLIYNFYSILIYYSTEPLPLQALAEVPGRSFCHSQVKHCARLTRLNEQCRKIIKMMILRHCFSCCFNFYFFQVSGSVVVFDRRGLNNEFYISVHTVNTSAVSAVCIILRTQDADPVKDIRKILINCFLTDFCLYLLHQTPSCRHAVLLRHRFDSEIPSFTSVLPLSSVSAPSLSSFTPLSSVSAPS